MKNNSKRREILKLLKKVVSLSLIVLIATSSMTACNFFLGSTNDSGYDKEDFGDIVDPLAPLTPEQAEKAEKTENFLYLYDYDLRDNGIRKIMFSEPINISDDYSSIAIYNNEKYTDPLKIFIDKKTTAAINYLLENCKETNNQDIKDISSEMNVYGNYKKTTITFNSPHGGNTAQKILSLISPFMPPMSDIYVEGADTITKTEKDELFEYLQSFDDSFDSKNITSVNLLRDLSEDNPNQMYSIQIVSTGFVIYAIKVSEEQYLKFNKYLSYEDIARDPRKYTDVHGVSYEDTELFLLNSSIPDILKDQVYNDVYELLKEKDLFNNNEQQLN